MIPVRSVSSLRLLALRSPPKAQRTSKHLARTTATERHAVHQARTSANAPRYKYGSISEECAVL